MPDTDIKTDDATMQEGVDAAWDESNAQEYPDHDFDDSAAEESPESKANFIGGTADLPKTDDAEEEKTEQADTEESDTAMPGAEAGDDAPEVDADLKSRANEAGWTDDEISGLNEAQLTKIVSAYEQPAVRSTKEVVNLNADPVKEEAKEDEEESPFELDPEYHDPDVIKAFKGLGAQNKQLQEELGEVKAHMRAGAQKAYQEGFDGWIEKLPDEYAEFLGEGPTSDLDENSAFFKRRSEIATAASLMTSSMIQAGNKPPTDSAMRKRGLYAVLGDKAAKIEHAIETRKSAERSKKTTAMPTHKRTPKDPTEPFGDEAAYEWAANFRRENGLDGDLAPLPDGQLEGI